MYFIPVGWTAHSGPAYMLAGTLGVPIYCRVVGWTTPSRPTYMAAGSLECPYILSLLAGPLLVGLHICCPAHMEHT